MANNLRNTTLIQQHFNTTLPVFFSKESLTLRIADYSNVYLLPVICVFGILTSILSIIVLAKINKFNENVYLYMMIDSVANLIFLLTQVPIAVLRCGILCPYAYTYGAKVFELYIYLYVGYVVVTFSALVDISVSIDRFLSFNVKRKAKLSRTHFFVRCLALFLFSAIAQIPLFCLSRAIQPVGLLVSIDQATNQTVLSETLYRYFYRVEWLNPTLQVFLTILLMIKGPALIFLVLVTNIFVAVKFKKHLENKKKVTASKN